MRNILQILTVLFFVGFLGCKSSEQTISKSKNPAQVQVMATIHKFHLKNPNYPYHKVTEYIQRFNPDIIGIEIRPEDIREDSAYLAQFYPLEMRQVLNDFPQHKIRGLDWYGNEMAGKKLSPDVFQNENTELGKIKMLEKALNRDSLMANALEPLAEMAQQQAALAMNSSPEILNNGQYDALTENFYRVLEAVVAGTPYQTLTDFNRQRDEIITENILKLVAENPGKRIIILIGANHRNRAVKALQTLPEGSVHIIPVQD